MAGCSNKDWIDVIVKSGYSTFASYTLILGLTMVLARSFVSMQSAIVLARRVRAIGMWSSLGTLHRTTHTDERLALAHG